MNYGQSIYDAYFDLRTCFTRTTLVAGLLVSIKVMSSLVPIYLIDYSLILNPSLVDFRSRSRFLILLIFLTMLIYRFKIGTYTSIVNIV